jgi:hypothetical protein
MKNFIKLIICIVLFFDKANAQNQNIKSDDYNRLALNIFIPDQVEKISDISSTLLKDKITMLLSKHGLTGNNEGGRFIVAPVINVLSKEITPTAPAMTIVELQFSLYIGDGYEGIKFASTSFTAKGIGQNLTKAYIDAIKKININDPSIPSFVESGKNKIIEYYNSKCDFILSDAKSLSAQNNFDEALYKINSIPEVCKECYVKASKLAVEYYLKAQERDCKIKLQQAENTWSANPTEQGAQEAASFLNQIDPETSCYSKAKSLIATINKTITTKLEKIEAFNRKMELMEKSNNFELEKARIGAVRDVAVAYANSRPRTVIYNVRGWW